MKASEGMILESSKSVDELNPQRLKQVENVK